MTTDHGTYVEHDGRPAVRFERTYPHPVATLWAAITEPDELAHWFPVSVAMEQRVGGKVEFGADRHVAGMTGEVLVFEPQHRVAFTWGADEVHLELTPTDNGCVLTLIDVLEAKDTAARNAAGWHQCLAALTKRLSVVATGEPQSWRALYDGYLAAGLPSGAWIPEEVR